ncbi:hypothetical protein PIB30_076224 [Stylosanthes scabra]|uniref:Uncharacterized protein n=1 Tax=Stylosanthes scabra TaxID=79078 RepID=A0ABU6UNX1_9FABA|nr:hypothetical protein [Stylosanthes scabra]
MGSGGSSSSPQPPPPPYAPDQALMKIREQHANFTEITRQLRDWTRNASARESYSVRAHQQANPNLVEMSSQKIVKQIYDNIDHKRPMLKGLLKKNEERKLGEQEMKFESKAEQELHAYAWKSTHMRATTSPSHA